MKKHSGILRYDADLDRFCLADGEEMADLHCGDVLGISIGSQYVWGRIEYDSEKRWYVIFPSQQGKRESAFTLRRGHWYHACVHW